MMAAKNFNAKKNDYYEEAFSADILLEAVRPSIGIRKKPTSLALEEKTIKELKTYAAKLEMPYQVLMRIFILDGLKRIKS